MCDVVEVPVPSVLYGAMVVDFDCRLPTGEMAEVITWKTEVATWMGTSDMLESLMLG